MSSAAHLARRHGLKAGMAKAASRVNPALLAIEAATAIAEAIDSHLKLKSAQARRDGLKELIPRERERLATDRERLAEQVTTAQAQLQNKAEVRKRLGELAATCAVAVGSLWDDLSEIRSADLPDLGAFENNLEQAEETWRQLQQALSLYNETND